MNIHQFSRTPTTRTTHVNELHRVRSLVTTAMLALEAEAMDSATSDEVGCVSHTLEMASTALAGVINGLRP